MGLKAAIQALKKAEKLKEKVQNSKDLLNDGEAWICQQQLQRIYQQVLILDLEYALDRKVEQELWNHGFKNYIGTLQNLAKDKKNPKRTDCQAMLAWFLDAASGFYLTLLQEICTAFDLDLPFRRKGSNYGSSKILRAVEHLSQPHKSSCYYICQHCLVHLGDIARYRNQSRQAEAFYRHAVQLAPNSGQPYNQLALLEASRGDKLSTVFHYVRSVEVRHPFPAAATNLARTLTKSAEEQLNVDGRNKLSSSEYIAVFLKFHGLLHSGSDFNLSEKYVKILTTTLTAHVATEGLTSWKFVQMLAINLFALHHAGGALDSDKPILTLADEQLTKDESHARHLILDLMAGSLSALLLPVYTLKDGDALLDYFALPAIKLTLDWIRLEPKVLLDAAFTSRLQIWPSLCKLLNGLQSLLSDVPEKYMSIPLPEDRDLQGFLPLEKAFNDLRFSNQDWTMDLSFINKVRAMRLVDFGIWLAKQEDYHLIANRLTEGPSKFFEAVRGSQIPTSDLIRELEELSLTKLPSPAPSEASSWGSSITGTSTPDGLTTGVVVSCPHSPPPPTNYDATQERRTGILKPQGSLEKSREKDDVANWNVTGHVPKRGRQNVAMQAIMRKSVLQNDSQESSRSLEAKQVTFKTPSPSNSPSSSQGTDEIAVMKSNVKQSAWPQQSSPLASSILQQSLQSQSQLPGDVQAQQTLQSVPIQQPLQQSSQQSLQQPSVQQRAQVSLQQSPQHSVQTSQQTSQQTSPQITPPQQQKLKIPQQNFPYKTVQNSGPTTAQSRPMIPFVTKGQSNQYSSLFNGFGTNNHLPLFANQTTNGIQNNVFPTQQQQLSRNAYGMKLHQPSYTSWQEETPPPPPPPTSWWGADQQSAANSRDDTGHTQVNSSAMNISFYNGLLHQQQQQSQGINHLKSSDANSVEMYPNNTWGSRQITAPSAVNLNLHHQLISNISSHHNHFASPPVTQNHSLLTGNPGFQTQHNKHDTTNHLSVFAANNTVEPDLNKGPSSDTQQSDISTSRSGENSIMFSTTPATTSFSPLGSLGTNTYSLFSSPNWSTSSLPCSLDMENNACRTGLSSVIGLGGNTLSLGQQSLWSGPGPSPLERLLEQQKQLREGPAPKGGT